MHFYFFKMSSDILKDLMIFCRERQTVQSHQKTCKNAYIVFYCVITRKRYK